MYHDFYLAFARLHADHSSRPCSSEQRRDDEDAFYARFNGWPPLPIARARQFWVTIAGKERKCLDETRG